VAARDNFLPVFPSFDACTDRRLNVPAAINKIAVITNNDNLKSFEFDRIYFISNDIFHW
jgi:hypothetical protein